MLEQLIGTWDYRTMPNKMLELVKNIGNMEQEGTGYFVDSEEIEHNVNMCSAKDRPPFGLS